MLVRLPARPAFQDGNGTMPDIIIELSQGPPDDPLILVPGAALTEHGLERSCEEERLKQIRLGLVKEQVSVVLLVGR